jgi:hypothetical protein
MQISQKCSLDYHLSNVYFCFERQFSLDNSETPIKGIQAVRIEFFFTLKVASIRCFILIAFEIFSSPCQFLFLIG